MLGYQIYADRGWNKQPNEKSRREVESKREEEEEEGARQEAECVVAAEGQEVAVVTQKRKSMRAKLGLSGKEQRKQM